MKVGLLQKEADRKLEGVTFARSSGDALLSICGYRTCDYKDVSEPA